MSIKRFNPNPEFTKNAWISSEEQYSNIYNESIQGPDTFWAKIAERLHWNKKWSSVSEFDFINANIKWFEGGKLDVKFTNIVWPGDSVTARGVLTDERSVSDDIAEARVWMEKDDGTVVIVGNAYIPD